MRMRIPNPAGLPRHLALLAALCLSLPATAQSSRALQSLDVTALDADRVLLTLTLSEDAPEPKIFTVEQPARLSVDLPDTRLALPERYRKLNLGKVRSVAAAQAAGRTRLVVELTELVPHQLRVDGRRVFLELGGERAAPPAASATRQGKPAPANRVLAVDFRRGDKGEGRVIVTLSDTKVPVDVREEGGKVVATIKNATVDEALVRRLDVLDFATPVKYVDVQPDGVNVRVAVTPAAGADFEQVAYQAGDQFTLELQPLTEAQRAERQRREPRYSGERISLNFQSVDVRSLLQIIADVAGVNMVVSDSVSGEIAMRLQNVPWDQALDIILQTKGLGMRQEGNVMLVAPIEELAAREKAELEASAQKQELAPLASELIQVNYAKASEIAALLKSGDNSLLSERGRVSVDQRTNTLLIQDTRERLAEIRALVARLDIPVRQVLIESRIVIANNDYTRELGTRFGITAVAENGNNGLFTTSGSGNSTDTTTQSFINSGFPVTLGGLQDRYNVSLPVASPAGRIAFAVLGSDYLVDLELSALQAEGRGEVISSPRVITANAKEASIEQGVEIPYQEASASGATAVTFKKAVLSLVVTPQITPDNRVIMDLSVKNDSVGQQVANQLGGTVPSIDTREVNTQVLVDNGQTVVLGGIYQQDNRTSTTKVPLLGDLPLLGALFRTTSRVANKRELLIFVTPKIMQEGLRVN